jgi:hypothetical protein
VVVVVIGGFGVVVAVESGGDGRALWSRGHGRAACRSAGGNCVVVLKCVRALCGRGQAETEVKDALSKS